MRLPEEMVFNNDIVGFNLNCFLRYIKKYFFLFAMNKLVLGFEGSQGGRIFNISWCGHFIKCLGFVQCYSSLQIQGLSVVSMCWDLGIWGNYGIYAWDSGMWVKSGLIRKTDILLGFSNRKDYWYGICYTDDERLKEQTGINEWPEILTAGSHYHTYK